MTMKALLNKIKLAIADSRIGKLTLPIYRLKYVPYADKGNKEVESYLISRPFDAFKNGIVAYAYGKGIRAFRYDRIVDREVVSLFGGPAKA